MGKGQAPPVARVVRGLGGRFAIARAHVWHGASRAGHGAAKVLRVGLVGAWTFGIIALAATSSSHRRATLDTNTLLQDIQRDMHRNLQRDMQQWLDSMQQQQLQLDQQHRFQAELERLVHDRPLLSR